MRIKDLHPWNIPPGHAIQLQAQLAKQVYIRPIQGNVRLVAGLDCSFDEKRRLIFAAAVLMNIQDMTVVEQAHAVVQIQFPYVPGLLSFREAPAMLNACMGLRMEPDLVLVDGQGIAHPRRLGIASHIGLFLDRPTIGCAKSILVGKAGTPGRLKDRYRRIIEQHTGQVIGAVVRTRTDVKPVYVSPGHMCNLEDAIYWTVKSVTCYRIPEPIRLAHQLADRLKG